MRLSPGRSNSGPDDAAEGTGLQDRHDGLLYIYGIIRGQAMKTQHCHISKSGRMSLPAEFRRALGLEQGGNVVVELNDREIRIRTLDDVVKGAQAWSRRVLAGKPKVTVDDFLAERRQDWKEP